MKGKVLFVACTPVARYMMEEIISNPEIFSSVEICGIVNLNSTQAINKANYDSYFDLSIKHNIPIFYCDNINDAESVEFIKDKKPDIIIQSGWSQKFGNELLKLPKYACIGEHPAPLPRGRGAACVNWAILTGEKSWGDTFFKMEEKYDEGVIYAQAFFDIEIKDDVKTVYDKVSFASGKIIKENIIDWCRGIFKTIEQDESLVTYYKRRKPDDGLFDFSMPLMETYNHIRAQARPYPGSFFMLDAMKYYVWKAALTDIEANEKYGTLIGCSNSGGLLVTCADRKVIELLREQKENSPEQWGAELYKS